MFEIMLSIFKNDGPQQTFLPVNGNPPIYGYDYCVGETDTEWWLILGNNGSAYIKNIWHYNGLTNTWTDHGPLESTITASNGSLAVFNGKLYWSYNAVHWEYTIATKVWVKLPAVVAPYADYGLVSFKYNTGLYYFGGTGNTSTRGIALYKYTPGVGWSTVSKYIASTSEYMSRPRYALIGDKVYFVTYATGYTGKIISYDFTTDTWGTFTTPGYIYTTAPAITASGKDIYLTGFDQTAPKLVLKYNTITQDLVPVTPLIVPRINPISMLVKNEIYIYAGNTEPPIQVSNTAKTLLVYPLKKPSPIGQASFTTSGTTEWTCPDGVTSVSCVCIGGGGWNITEGGRERGGAGGGLRYANNIPVEPGKKYVIKVGYDSYTYPDTAGDADSSVFGITAGTYDRGTPITGSVKGFFGGQAVSAATGGNAIGGNAATYFANGQTGSSGTVGGQGTNLLGVSGILATSTRGAALGGGASGKNGTRGGFGGVRIMWGDNRAYPNRNVADMVDE